MINRLMPTEQLPLYRKRILITAPRNYASRLASEVLIQGGLPVLMPMIETCCLNTYDQLDNNLTKIAQFDWIAFTSRNGIEGFLQRLKQLDIPLSVLNQCRLIAIGKDAECLAEYGLEVYFIPDEPSPQGIVWHLSQTPNIEQQSILVPVPHVVGIPEPNIIPKFLADLQRLGMKVTSVETYQTRCLEQSLYEVEIELLKQGKIDLIAFSSTGEIEAFLQLVNQTKTHYQSVIACFGPYTAANAKKLGLNVNIVGKNYHSFAGFVQAIATYFSCDHSTEIPA